MLILDRSTAEKYRMDNRPVWILGMRTAMPLKVRIHRICEDDHAIVDFINDGENGAFRTKDACIDDMYESKEDLIAAMFEDIQKKTAEIKAAIQTKDDCIRFMFSHSVSGCAEFTDWTARRAIQKIAMERWGLELK